MISASVLSVVEALSLLCDIVLVARLFYLKLYRVYLFFFLSLLVPILIEPTAVYFGTKSRAFFYSYVVLEPIRNVLYILVIWELFSVIFRNYAGLRSLSRWVMGLAAIIAPIGLVLSIPHGTVYVSRYVMTVVRFERGIAMGLVVFMIIMLYFISRYPIKLPRNIVVLCMIYSIWFLGDAAILLASSFLPKATGGRIVNLTQGTLGVFCYLGWALLLSKAGEFQETRVRRAVSAEDEQALIGELDAMNQMLLRAGRSISHSR